MVENDESIGSGAVKRRFYLPHEELLDRVEEEAEQFEFSVP